MSETMVPPVDGDILRTRFVFQAFGRFPKMTFWWRVIHWDSRVTISLWCRTIVLRYFFAVQEYQNSQSRVTCVQFANLTHPAPTTMVGMDIRGVSGPPSVTVMSQTLWTTRWGIDASGNQCRSLLPMSNVAMPQRAGRADGDGQPFQWFDYLTADQLFSAVFPTEWVSGFISRKDGSFVQCLTAHMNPQIKELVKRTRRCAYNPPLLLP